MISILAPSRERLARRPRLRSSVFFQSSLPHGSDYQPYHPSSGARSFSILAPSRERLIDGGFIQLRLFFSIHAPSRERQWRNGVRRILYHFNPRSLTGATYNLSDYLINTAISIHAPLRERPAGQQSEHQQSDFNPRSLTGATIDMFRTGKYNRISIHAPLRERPLVALTL